MLCPLCAHGSSRVLLTTQTLTSIVRVRICAGCGHKWKTAEVPAELADKARAVLDGVKAIAETVL